MTWVDSPNVNLSGSSITSADQYFDESQRRMMIRRFTPDFEYQSADVDWQISSRDRPRSTAVTTSYTLTSSETKEDFRKSGRIFSLYFQTSGTLRFGKPVFDIVPMGER